MFMLDNVNKINQNACMGIFYLKKVKEADLLKSCLINWWNDVVTAINSC